MGWWEYAKPGDKVVCIRDVPLHWPQDQREFMIRGKVYEIAEMEAHGKWVFFNFIGGVDFYSHQGFRPVDPKSTETGMKMIRKLLGSVPVKDDA